MSKTEASTADSRIDRIPDSLRPTKAGVAHTLQMTAVTAACFLAASVIYLFDSIRWTTTDGEAVPTTVVYAYHVLSALTNTHALLIFAGPLLLLLLLKLPPVRRLIAATAGSLFLFTFFGAVDGLEDGLWQAYFSSVISVDGGVDFYFQQMLDSGIQGGENALVGLLLFALPIYLALLAVNRWTAISLLAVAPEQ
jgi:hypothetical protein